MTILIMWLVTALFLIVISYLLPGVSIDGFATALVATLVMGLINLTIRPLVTLLTLPINIMTLGVFSLVINAAMLSLVAWLIPGFEVATFWSAFVAALILSLANCAVVLNDDRYAI